MTPSRRWPDAAFVGLIFGAAFIAYWPALSGGFLWDDDVLLTASPLVHASDGLYRMWFTSQAIDYWPLTGTSFWLEWRLWGLNPVGYHTTNVLLHVVSALLLCAILRRLKIPGAQLAALLFVVHPVNVESVAWIAQRKNTLAMALFLLSTLWFVADEFQGTVEAGARRRGGTHWYWLSVVAFALAMLSKGSVAPLPAMLLLIVWWRRQTLTRRDLLRAVPFVAIAITLTIVNIVFQTGRTGIPIRDVTVVERVLGAGAVVWFYLYKALLPLKMTFVYPQWDVRGDEVLWWLPLVATIVITGVLAWQRRRPPVRALLFAWTFFCLALLPVMGLVDVYFMRYSLVADHYQYIALLAVVTLVSAGTSRWLEQRREPVATNQGRRLDVLIQAGCVSVLLALTTATWSLSHHYADAATLYGATLRDNPGCWSCETNLAVPLVARGTPADLGEAMTHLSAAARMQPAMPEIHIGLGVVLQKLGRVDDAIAEYERALSLNPRSIEARANLVIAREQRGIDRSRTGQFASAVSDLTRVVEEAPGRAVARRELGYALLRLERSDAALAQLHEAVRLDPTSAETHDTLATVWRMLQRPDQAIAEYREAVRLAPNAAEWHNNLGSALLDADRREEAAREFREAVRCDPASSRVHRNLGVTLAALGQLDEAVAALRTAVRLDPQDGDARAALDGITTRRGGK